MNVQPTSDEPPPSPVKLNWLVFFVVLLGPLILSCVAGALDKPNGGVSPIIALIAGGAAGIICGVMLSRRFAKNTEARIVLDIVFSIIMIVVCIGLNCFGCLASGYQMRFN